jgi:hypothetical protein
MARNCTSTSAVSFWCHNSVPAMIFSTVQTPKSLLQQVVYILDHYKMCINKGQHNSQNKHNDNDSNSRSPYCLQTTWMSGSEPDLTALYLLIYLLHLWSTRSHTKHNQITRARNKVYTGDDYNKTVYCSLVRIQSLAH